MDLQWKGEDVNVYEILKQRATSLEKPIPQLIKEIIKRELGL
ncbi:hypothetical protein [Rivularia sp. PCC 7116]|nr:hypothetical protein [Rivularia sp. PCC 7116]